MGIGVLKKNIFYLARLMLVPEALEKSFEMDLNYLASLTVGYPMRSVSSTNCSCVEGELVFLVGSLFRWPYITIDCISLPKPFDMRNKI